MQQAVQLTPDGHPDMPRQINDVGMSFLCRSWSSGNISDVSEAISNIQRAVQLTHKFHPDMPMFLNFLGLSFQRRFDCAGNVSDLAEVITSLQQAVHHTPDGHPAIPMMLFRLGKSFQRRFERTGDVCDLTDAIPILQRGLKLTPDSDPDMPERLDMLANSLHSRFERTGNVSDLSEAISVQQWAVQLTLDDNPILLARVLSNLIILLQSRFHRTGNVSDLLEAILIQQRAVQRIPDGHPDMARHLYSLGTLLHLRFRRIGNGADLLEAISIHQRAVQLTPDGHPYMPAHLSGLGDSLKSHFDHTGDVFELAEAISNHRRAVQLTPDDHPHMPAWLVSLGDSLYSHFKRTGNVSDLWEAISVQQRAIQLTPDGQRRMPARLNALGVSFWSRFEHTGNIAHLLETISIQQRAVQLTPDGHHEMPIMLTNLGTSYLRRLECTPDGCDLSEAISVHQQAVRLTPSGHPFMPLFLHKLGMAFLKRFERTGDIANIHSAASTFRESVTALGSPFVRLEVAQLWARLSMAYDLPHTLTAYGAVIDLIFEIAGMDRTIEQRHTHLIEISTLTTRAAAAAFTLGDVEKALEWLEQGRCLVWSQLNQLRTPVDQLRAHNEHLAQRFSDISSALEASGSRRGTEGLSIDAPLSQKIVLQDEACLQINLSRKWGELLDEIRCIPQFHNFLRPPQASYLLKRLPKHGVVILINVDETRCDALALVSGSDAPIHITLDDFTHKEASDLTESLRHFLSSHRVRMREVDRAGRPVLSPGAEKQSGIHVVLKALWLRVVKPILDGLAFSVSVFQFVTLHVINILYKSTPASDPARIWWCPTGPLAFLPLHAAGIYGRNRRSPPGSCISDFAISSYTPNVSSLLEKLNKSVNIPQPASSKLLVISQPNTPGCSPIPATTKEMNCIWQTIERNNGECLPLEGESASVSQVKLEMESHGSIHLACHASQDLENPLRSGFYLHDGRLELSEIMKQKFTVHELAFLSACQTSTGTEKLSEEAVHLAAGMLAAGYRGVVATMWSIKDKYGPVVAESFYKDLMERGKTSGKPGLNSDGAAHALHHAIQGIRETLGDTEEGLLTWVPYVHFGC